MNKLPIVSGPVVDDPIVNDADRAQAFENAIKDSAKVTPLASGEIIRTKDGHIDALALDLDGWKKVLVQAGERAFRAKQIFSWIHARKVRGYDEMTDLSKTLRHWLQEHTRLLLPTIDDVKVSEDGTRKYQLRTTPAPGAPDGDIIEAVWLPHVSGPGQNALCISSQVGCAMGCTFCATAALKLRRQLSGGEIAGQVYTVWRDLEEAGLVEEREGKSPRPITHIVYMGMGEPLHNYAAVVASIRALIHPEGIGLAPRRITVSTSGLVPAIARLGTDTDVQIAISLNATTDTVRDVVMPVNRRYNIEALLDACRAFPLLTRRRITFEYVLLANTNDSDDDARRLVELLDGFSCRLNLIPFNPHPLSDFSRPSNRRIDSFRKIVTRGGLEAFVRTTRGDDIDAACGMLGAKKLEEARQFETSAPTQKH